MLEKCKAYVLTILLTIWSTVVLAQTAPSGASAPTGATTSANPGDASGAGVDWIWITVALVVIVGLLFYFFARRHTEMRT